ncbi:MAG: FKBP-type peptidyl-prolyl cis-trans isomerase [Bacteroidales bacterium]|nr:FKBP-type peptidyl-prolyl cis-trans isomerase [Bacteroidales bacterium]
MKKNILTLIIIPFIFFSSCKSKEEKEAELLQAYITEHNITTVPTASGLYYIETLEGTGETFKTNDMVTVHYTGTFLDGEKFDSSYDWGTPFTFELGTGQVIRGWDEGISYMKPGGKASLIIPSKLGYGSVDRGSIPAYSTLIFDIEALTN